MEKVTESIKVSKDVYDRLRKIKEEKMLRSYSVIISCALDCLEKRRRK